jgi:carboxyvinyl-carboxyphosphonate phosphorylmutase
VVRTIQEIETAAAVTIEDTILPRPNKATDDVLIPIPEMVEKLRVALAARQGPSFVIVARTRSLATEGQEQVIERIKVYSAAGVDAVMPFRATKASEVEAVHRVTSLPLMLISDPPELKDRDFLSANGVRMMFRADFPYWMGITAMYNAFKHLSEGEPAEHAEALSEDGRI